nr:FecR domain-containing protein [uncultured Dyadobacter sp.]
MKQSEAIDLMHRFIADSCNEEEVTRVIALMGSEKNRQLYGQLMDAAVENGAMKPVAVADQVIEKNYRTLEERLGIQHRRRNFPSWKWQYFAAAAIAGILIVAALVIYRLPYHSAKHYATGFGETKRISLPDGSVVTLNGNSDITYRATDRTGTRSVELRGEAFFEIRKTPDHQKFEVIMPGTGRIQVLGTEFNVRHRSGQSRVVLRSGSIRLTVAGGTLREVFMKPGELVDISANAAITKRSKVDPSLFDHWTTHKLVFENTPLREIADMLRDTYGLDVVIDDPKLLDKKLSGTAPIHDPDTFLEALSGSFDLRIERKQNKVTITAH